MGSKGQVDVMAVGIVEAGSDNRRFEIVVADDRRHAAEIAKRALMEPEERLELLIPDGFFVPMARVPQRHPEDPGPAPFAGARVERRSATEEIDLGFRPRGAMNHAHGPPPRRERPDESLHRFVAGPVAVLLDQVLPDSLQAQAGIELLGDGGPIDRRGKPAPGRRAGERFGRIWSRAGLKIRGFSGRSRVRAGERFGRICPPPSVVAADRLTADAGLGFDPAIAPPELQEGENLRLLRHFQVVRHRRP
jgi:hypothetical protein